MIFHSLEKRKTEGEDRGFQPSENRGRRPGFSTFPRDLANVNEWKIMFDP